jgi:hypothetical protein
MTVDYVCQSLTAATPPAELTPALRAYGGIRRAIGRGLTNLLRGTMATRVRGFTPTCIARKATRAMQRTGTVGLVSLFAGSRWMRNGSAS